MRMKRALFIGVTTLCLLAVMLLVGPTLAYAQSPSGFGADGAPSDPLTAGVTNLWLATYSGTHDTMPGRTIRYFITFGNLGPDAALAATVRDSLPRAQGGQSLLTWEWDNSQELGLTRIHGEGESRELVWRGDIATGQTKNLEIVLRVASDASTCYLLETRASISSATLDLDPTDNTATAIGPQVRLPDLSVSKTVTGLAVPGETITYTLVYSNIGCVAAQGVVLYDDLPRQVSFVWASTSPSEMDGHHLVWRDDVLDIGAGHATVIQVTVRVDDLARTGDVLTNTATITNALVENTPINNQAVTTSTVGRADLALAKTCPADAIPGGLLVYVLRYTNIGQVAAEAVRLVDDLAVGVSHVTTLWQSEGSAPAALMPVVRFDRLEWDLGSVPAGASGVLTVTAVSDGERQDGEWLHNAATLYTATPEDTLSNNAAYCQTLVRRADLWVRKSCPSASSPGDALTYRLDIGNRGTTTATAVVLTDCLPVEVDYEHISIAHSSLALTQIAVMGNCYVWALPNLAPGVTGTLQLMAPVRIEAGEGRHELGITNTAHIATQTPESSLLDNEVVCVTSVRRADLELCKALLPADIATAGQAVTFTLAYCNLGALAAEHVLLTDSMPLELNYRVAGTAPAPSQVAEADGRRVLTWSIGRVPAGASALITLTGSVQPLGWDSAIRTLTNTAWITTTSPESNVTNDVSAVSLRVAPGCPASALLWADPSYLPADGTSVTQMTLVLSDTFGNQVLDGTVVRLTTSRGRLRTGGGSEGALSLTSETVSGGVTVELVADQRASVAMVEARVIGPGEGCLVEAMGEVRASRMVTFEAVALQISKSVLPSQSVTPGEPVTYTIVYTNAGPGTAMSTQVTDRLPPNFVRTGITSSLALTLTVAEPDLLMWDSADLAPRVTGSIIITGRMDAEKRTWERSQPVSNCVSIASQTHDVTIADNTACAMLSVLTADVWIAKQPRQADVRPGGTVAWRILVGNRGPAVARSVLITDTLPAGVVTATLLVSIPGAVLNDDNTVTLPVGDLVSGEERLISVVTEISRDDVRPGQLLENRVRVSTLTYEFLLTDNEAGTVVTVQAPDLRVRLEPQAGAICQDREMTYLIAYENVGTAMAEGVVITLTLDPQICPTASGECPREVRFQIDSLDRGQSGELAVRCKLPLVSPRYGDFGARVLTSYVDIASSSPEPTAVRGNNRDMHDLTLQACLFLLPLSNW